MRWIYREMRRIRVRFYAECVNRGGWNSIAECYSAQRKLQRIVCDRGRHVKIRRRGACVSICGPPIEILSDEFALCLHVRGPLVLRCVVAFTRNAYITVIL